MPNPDWKKFLEDKELRIKWAKENCQILKMGMDGKTVENPQFDLSDDEIERLVTDPVKIEKYTRARKIVEKEQKCIALANKYLEEGLPHPQPALLRLYSFLLDTSGTEEADQKNKKLINKIATPEGSLEVVNQCVKDCLKFDISKIRPESDDELFDVFENHFQDLQKMFLIKQIASQGEHNFNPELQDFIRSSLGVIEDATSIRTKVCKYASNYYLTLPTETLEKKGTTPEEKEKVTSGIVFAQMKLDNLASERLRKNDPGTDSASNTPEKFFQLYFAQVLEEVCNEKYEDVQNNYDKLKQQGIFTKDFLKTYKCRDKDGKQVPIYNAIQDKNFDDYKFEKYSFDYKNRIEKLCDDPVWPYYKIKDYENKATMEILNHVEIDKVDKAKGTRCYNRINAVKDTIKQLYNVQPGDKEIPSVMHDNFMAATLVKELEEKHESRTFWWKLWHPIQNSNEEAAVTDCKNLAKELGHISNTDWDTLYNNAKTYNRDKDGKYYFEEGKEPFEFKPEELTAKKFDDKYGPTTTEVIDEEDFQKQLGIDVNKTEKSVVKQSEKQVYDKEKKIEINIDIDKK